MVRSKVKLTPHRRVTQLFQEHATLAGPGLITWEARKQVTVLMEIAYLQGKADAVRELREEMDGRAKSRDARKRLFNETPSPERG